MIDDVRRLLVRELEALAREVELFPDDESLWKTAPGVTNSAGNLALHACGNLRHFVGAVLGGTGYVRDRPAEFASSGADASLLRPEADAFLRNMAESVSAMASTSVDLPTPPLVFMTAKALRMPRTGPSVRRRPGAPG